MIRSIYKIQYKNKCTLIIRDRFRYTSEAQYRLYFFLIAGIEYNYDDSPISTMNLSIKDFKLHKNLKTIYE